MTFENFYPQARNEGSRPARARSSMRRNRLLRGCALGALFAGASSAALGLTIHPVFADEVIDGGQTVTIPGEAESLRVVTARPVLVGG